MKSFLPKFVTKFFWGNNLSQLNWNKHQKYISQTLLEKGDEKAVSWLLNKQGRQKLKRQLTSLRLSPKSANFWRLYL